MINPLLAGLATTLFSLGAQAGIPVASYTMFDSVPHWNAYHDNLYNGTRHANGLLTGGTGDLTDGVTSQSVAFGYGAWAPYVLWDGASPVITFDLGTRHDLTSVTTYFKFYPSAAVYLPGSMGLRFSDDGVQFGSAQLRSLLPAERSPGGDDSNGVVQVLTAPASARFVELSLNQGAEGRWLALGEVVFQGAASPVPEPHAAWMGLLGLCALLGLRQKRPA